VIATALAVAWGALVLAWAGHLRPAPRRVRALVPDRQQSPQLRRPRLHGVIKHRPVLVRASVSAAVAMICGALFPPGAPLAGAAVWLWPTFRARRYERRRAAALVADLPEVVDLLALAVGAGLTNRLALEGVVRHGHGALVAELDVVLEQVRLGRRLADALAELPTRAGEAVRPLSTVLVTAERYGAPLERTMGRLADDVRRQRQRRAEEAARRVPVKLLFPLVLCVLPAFGLLTVAPLVASALRSLRL
jgi:tight adherence protein C